MPFDVALVQRRLETVLPARRDEFEIALLEPAAATKYDGHPPVYVDSSGQLVAALSIKVFDLAPRRVVCSVTQQRVVLARPSDRDDARVMDYAVGWARALAHLAARCRELDTVAPRDLAYPEALDETAPRTEEDFYRVFTTRDDLLVVWEQAHARADQVTECEDSGVGAHADALIALERPAIEIRTAPIELAGAVEPGASRLGGLPDLPRGAAWPRWNGEPLDFIAQIDLDAVARRGLDQQRLLPPRGVLAFFFALTAAGPRDLSDPAWRGGGRVLYFDAERSTLAAAAPPDGYDPQHVLPPRSVALEASWQGAPLVSPYYPALLNATGYQTGLDQAIETFHEYASRRACSSLELDAPLDHLLGYGDPLQHSPNVNCEGHSSGAPADAWGEAPDFWRRAADWQLLLQAISDRRARVSYGDGGVLYFMLRSDDLAARRFDRVWTDLQSY